MTLEEIKKRLSELDDLDIGQTMEDYHEYCQRLNDGLPRMPFKELPLSLQREVRTRHTPDALLRFLKSCYNTPEEEEYIKTLSQEEQKKLIRSVDTYISFDSIVDGIPDIDLEKILIRCRNTAIYTVEYYSDFIFNPDNSKSIKLNIDHDKLVPYLYGNHAVEAFETATREYREREQKRKQREQAEQPKNKPSHPPQPTAKASNLVSAGDYQYIISDQDYQHALTTKRNKNAYIALMNPDFFKQLDFSGEDGVMTYNHETAGIIKQYSKGKYDDIKDLDFPLLTQVYTAAMKALIRHDSYTVTVSIPEFFREMGIDTSSGNAPDIMAKLHSFENCVGIMPGTGTVSKLFSIIEINTPKQTMTFAVPYIIRLLEALKGHNHIERKTRKGEELNYIEPFLNKLVHSTIVSERNKPAVEIVCLITNGLLQRGYVPDKETYSKKGAKTQYPDRITWSKSFRSLIDDAPLLRGRIASYDSTSDKNKALRRTFEKAYQLIDTKTDAAKWFINLKYRKIIPTMATLDDEIIFTHTGKNGDYNPKGKTTSP